MYLANCLALAIESPLYYSYMCLNFYSAAHKQLVSTCVCMCDTQFTHEW